MREQEKEATQFNLWRKAAILGEDLIGLLVLEGLEEE